MATKHFCEHLSLVLIREGDAWAAQCLEHDLAAQGATHREALDNLGATLMGQIALDIRRGREPLAALPPAPDTYFTMFREASALADPAPLRVPDMADAPPAYQIAAIHPDVRVYG